MQANKTTIDTDLFEDLLSPFEPALSPAVAEALLRLKFSPKAKRRINQLLERNSQGDISPEDRIVLDKFVRMGTLLDLIHAKARLALKDAGERASA